jgi:uncharacterized membrane protein
MRTTGTRFGVVGVLVAASLAAGPLAASATPDCEIHELPLPAGASAGTVLGSSPDGSSLVGSADGNAVIWRGGAITEAIPGAPGALVDLTGTGIGAGDSVDGQNAHHPWVYRDGTVRRLTGEGTVYAVGEDGHIVGSRLMSTPNGQPVAVPATWAPGADDPVDLPMPSQETGRASDISADGTIVGTVGLDAYVWRADGTHFALKRPDGVSPTEMVSADRISGPWVVGTASSIGVVRWNLGTGTVEPVTAGDQPAVNDSGAVLAKHGYDAVVVADGTVTTLPGLDGRPMNYPASISTDARTLGGTAQTNQNPSPVTERPVYWTCG